MALLGIVAAAGAVILLRATYWGVGVEYDSVFYLSAAQNLLHGLGLSRLGGGGEVIPLTHYPPLYPLLLYATGAVSRISISMAAQVASIVSFGALIFLSGIVVYCFMRSLVAGLAAALLVAASPVLLSVDAWAMSETLYLVLLVACLASLAAYAGGVTWRNLLWAAGLTSLAYLTRYVGVAIVGTGLVVILLSGDLSWRQKVGRGIVYGSLSVVPVALWMGRNILLTGLTTNRVLLFHPPGRSKLSEAAHAVAGWILPGAWPFRLRLAITVMLLLLLAAFALWRWWTVRTGRRGKAEAQDRLVGVLALHAVVYTTLLVVSLTFLDASTRLDDRILSPLCVVVLLAAVVVGGWRPTGIGDPRWIRWPVATLLALALLFSVQQSVAFATGSARHGLGFNSRSWVTSPTVAWARSLPPNGVLYSNEAFPLYYLTDRPVYWAPEAVDPVKGESRPELTSDLDLMRQRLKQPDSFLVIFHPDNLRVEMPRLSVLTQGLKLMQTTSDAQIYTAH